MFPVPDPNHVTEGLGMRLGQYLKDAQLQALLTAFLGRIQDAENMLNAVIASSKLSTYSPASLLAAGLGPGGPATQGYADGPPCQALLQLADVIGCPVNGQLTTAQLFFLIGIWRLARKSKGRAEDLIRLLAAAFGPGGASYTTYPLASFGVVAPSLTDGSLIGQLAQALKIARPPGVYAILDYGYWPATASPGAGDVSGTFFLGGYGVVGSGLMDGYSGSNAMGLLASTEV
jgi:hypothetical protein